MTTKKKAKELVQLFYNNQCSHSITELAYKSAKQCALICIDEMLKQPQISDKQLNHLIEVKQETNKL